MSDTFAYPLSRMNRNDSAILNNLKSEFPGMEIYSSWNTKHSYFIEFKSSQDLLAFTIKYGDQFKQSNSG